MYMDTKKIKIVIASVSILAILSLMGYLYVNIKSIKAETQKNTRVEEPKEDSKSSSKSNSNEMSDFWEETDSSEEAFSINNTVEEIFDRVSNAENEDRVGKVDGEDIYVLKLPELITKPLLYSESEVMVRHDNYVCVKYEPEKSNEKYILIVYYFDSDMMWESWYKYIFAKNNKEAEKLAEEEKENGYPVWIEDTVVLVGEQFSDPDVSEEIFMNTLENKKIYLD